MPIPFQRDTPSYSHFSREGGILRTSQEYTRNPPVECTEFLYQLSGTPMNEDDYRY